jgi:hypothetical protein
MNMIVIIALALIGVAAFVVYRLRSVQLAGQEELQRRFKRIQPLFTKIVNEEPLKQEDVYPYAANILTREATYSLLKDHDLVHLFPDEYLSQEQAGASYLANWLELPSELDACPDEVEFVKRISVGGETEPVTHYDVYKYRINAPHPLSGNGWMIGIAGPCYEGAGPYDQPRTSFNRVNRKFDSVSPEDEVRWVHEHVTNQKDATVETFRGWAINAMQA